MRGEKESINWFLKAVEQLCNRLDGIEDKAGEEEGGGGCSKERREGWREVSREGLELGEEGRVARLCFNALDKEKY